MRECTLIMTLLISKVNKYAAAEAKAEHFNKNSVEKRIMLRLKKKSNHTTPYQLYL